MGHRVGQDNALQIRCWKSSKLLDNVTNQVVSDAEILYDLSLDLYVCIYLSVPITPEKYEVLIDVYE